MSSSVTLPASGLMQSGTVYELRTLALPISELGFGWWPTHVATDDGKTPEAHLAMKERMKGGPRQTITSLAVMVKAVERELWPTPTAHPRTHTPRPVHHGRQLANEVAAREKWPTPTANRRSGLQSHGHNAILGPLNPTFLEWLMGFPTGWTAVAPSETPSSPGSRNGSDDAS